MLERILKIGLCKGRHQINEIDNYFFEEEITNPLDFEGLEKTVHKKLKRMEYFSELHLYVTGLTPALIAVLNVVRNCKVILYHFDRETGEYKGQEFGMTGYLAKLEKETYGL